MKHRLACIVFCITLIASCAHAQVPTGVGSINLVVSTNNPAPGDSVTITAESYTADMNSSKITWTVNGKATEQGIGAATLTLTAPALGKHLTVNVSAVTSSGAVINETTTVSSGVVDMVLENSGYVPPFFAGKIAPSYQNEITIIAIPHLANSSGAEYDPSSLVYQWKKNGSVLQDQSGYGKQSITLTGDLLPRAYTVNVLVTTRDGATQSAGYITVSPQSPSIVFYSNDALYGPLYNKSVPADIRIGSQKEVSVLAVPFGFDKPVDGLGDLSFSWSINGVGHPELDSGDSVTLRAPTDQAGSSNISLSIANAQKILQGVQDSFSVNFAANQTGTDTPAPVTF